MTEQTRDEIRAEIRAELESKFDADVEAAVESQVAHKTESKRLRMVIERAREECSIRPTTRTRMPTASRGLPLWREPPREYPVGLRIMAHKP